MLSIKNWLRENSLFPNFDKSAILLHFLFEYALPTLSKLKIHEKTVKHSINISVN